MSTTPSPAQQRLAREMRGLDDEHLTAFHDARRERDQLLIEVIQRRNAMADIVRVLGEGCCGLLHEEIAPKVKEQMAHAEKAETQHSIAKAEWLAFANEREEVIADVRAERDELRTEVATLKAAHWIHSLTEDQLSEARFYADLEGYRVRAEKTEQAFVKERARLDTLIRNCWVVHEGDINCYAVYSPTIGDYITDWVATPHEAIDEAIASEREATT